MRQSYIKPERRIEEGIDFDAHYRIGRLAVAYYLLGWEAENRPVMCYGTDDDGNEVEVESGDFELERTDNVIAVMVGDDHRHIVDRSDLVLIGDTDYCAECGQIGCTHDGRDRAAS